jgi:malonyl CoA-acyl carrier protein transacylase
MLSAADSGSECVELAEAATACVFPGQGSRWRSHAEEFFDAVPEFAELEASIDEVLGFSVRRLCMEDGELLDNIRYAQPTLYLINALHYYSVARQAGRARFLAGHSLGEFNALLAAGAFDLITGLRLVKKRSELIASAPSGAMAAVMGMEPLRVAELLRRPACAELDIAHYNSPAQTTIAGPGASIRRAGIEFEANGAMCVPLNIRVALHSRLLRRAAEDFGAFMSSIEISPPKVTVISNVTARPYPQGSANAVKELLQRQLVEPVNWLDTIRYLMSTGVAMFKEIGPGDVLTRLLLQFRH